MARRSVTIIAHNETTRIGEVVVFGGALWHAQDRHGEGEDAFKRLALTQAAVLVEPLVSEPGRRTIRAPWEKLMMAAAVAADEEGFGLSSATTEESGTVRRGDRGDPWDQLDAIARDERPTARPPSRQGVAFVPPTDELVVDFVDDSVQEALAPPHLPSPDLAAASAVSNAAPIRLAGPVADPPLVTFVPTAAVPLSRLGPSLVPEPLFLRRRRLRQLWTALVGGVVALGCAVFVLGTGAESASPSLAPAEAPGGSATGVPSPVAQERPEAAVTATAHDGVDAARRLGTPNTSTPSPDVSLRGQNSAARSTVGTETLTRGEPVPRGETRLAAEAALPSEPTPRLETGLTGPSLRATSPSPNRAPTPEPNQVAGTKGAASTVAASPLGSTTAATNPTARTSKPKKLTRGASANRE